MFDLRKVAPIIEQRLRALDGDKISIIAESLTDDPDVNYIDDVDELVAGRKSTNKTMNFKK